MSKHPSLKPKRQSKAKTCLGQRLASERKKRNRQGKESVSPEVASKKYREALSMVKNIRDTEFGYRRRDWRDW